MFPLDLLDKQIILALNVNCRTSYQALAHELGLSVNAVKKRINKLIETGVILEFNPEAERVYGRSRGDVLGKDYLELFVPENEREAVLGDIRKVLGGQRRCEALPPGRIGELLSHADHGARRPATRHR